MPTVRLRASATVACVFATGCALSTGTPPDEGAEAIGVSGATLFASNATPTNRAEADSASVELGVRFRVDVDGSVTSLRFYKGAGNTGTHTGHLWTDAGALLGSVTFTNEGSTGWQTAHFTTPIALHAGSVYVASYHAPNGHYADDANYFATAHDSGVLHALRDGTSGHNGVYHYGSTAFPTDSWRASNYWVDVDFSAASTAHDAGAPDVAPTRDASAPVDAGQPSRDASAPHDASAPVDATTPPSSAWPGASNTGVPAGTTLRASGALTITTANTVIDGLDISGPVRVQASNVTIRRSRINAQGSDFGVYVVSGSVAIEDSEILGSAAAAIAFDHWSGLRLNIHGFAEDGCKLGSNTHLEDSWIHDFAPQPGDHADGCQMQSGERDIVLRHNFIDARDGAGHPTNSTLFMAPDLGPSSSGPVTIDHNLLNGGNYTVYIVDGNNGQYHETGYIVTNNHFGRQSNYGPLDINEAIGTWSGNVWDDTGATISP